MSKTHKCRYCNTKKVCRTCRKQIKCQVVTDCAMCGGLNGRPLRGPIAAGLLIVDVTVPRLPRVLLVVDPNGIGDAGGKVDPDLDASHYATVFREVYEETALLVNVALWRLPYVDLRGDYRLYVALHSVDSPAFVYGRDEPELPSFWIPIEILLRHLKKETLRLTPRFKILLRQKLNFADGTALRLIDFLASLTVCEIV